MWTLFCPRKKTNVFANPSRSRRSARSRRNRIATAFERSNNLTLARNNPPTTGPTTGLGFSEPKKYIYPDTPRSRSQLQPFNDVRYTQTHNVIRVPDLTPAGRRPSVASQSIRLSDPHNTTAFSYGNIIVPWRAHNVRMINCKRILIARVSLAVALTFFRAHPTTDST